MIALLLLGAAIVGWADPDRVPRTLFPLRGSNLGGCGGPDFRLTTLKGSPVMFGGGPAYLIMERSLFLSIDGSYMEGDAEEIMMGYGGLSVGYLPFPRSFVSLWVSSPGRTGCVVPVRPAAGRSSGSTGYRVANGIDIDGNTFQMMEAGVCGEYFLNPGNLLNFSLGALVGFALVGYMNPSTRELTGLPAGRSLPAGSGDRVLGRERPHLFPELEFRRVLILEVEHEQRKNLQSRPAFCLRHTRRRNAVVRRRWVRRREQEDSGEGSGCLPRRKRNEDVYRHHDNSRPSFAQERHAGGPVVPPNAPHERCFSLESLEAGRDRG